MLEDAKPALRPLLLIWLAGSVILTIAAWHNISSLSGWDPDDQLRLVQLRDLLNGQGWFDNSQYRLNTPDGTDMHWSRVTELPLALIVLLLSPILGQAVAEMIAGTVIPLLLLLGTGLFLGDIARRIGGVAAAPIAMLLCLLVSTILAQFMPMRIDHHGWQIMLACAALWSLFLGSKRKGGLFLGSALALWLHISIEGAPLAAMFFAYLGWLWAFRRAHGERLLWTLVAFTSGSALLFLVAKGTMLASHCDVISFAHLLAIAAASVVMLVGLALRPASKIARVGVVLMAGGGAAGTLLFAAPTCLSGGFGALDPLVREFWYGSVTEGLPLWRQAQWGAIGWIFAALMGVYAYFVVRDERILRQRAALSMLIWFQIASLAVAVFVFRASAVACAFAVPVLANWLAGMAQKYHTAKLPKVKLRLALMMAAIIMAGPITMQLLNRAQQIGAETKAAAHPDSDGLPCDNIRSVAALSALENARIIAPFDIGPAILLTTPHSVLASSHHRNNAGMRDQIIFFGSSATKAYEISRKRGITHLAICADEDEMAQYAQRYPNGLWAQMQAGDVPGWLKRGDDLGAGIEIWKVVEPVSD